MPLLTCEANHCSLAMLTMIIVIILTFLWFQCFGFSSANLLIFGTTLCPALPAQKYHISSQLYLYPLHQSHFFPSPLLYSVHLACCWSHYLPFEADEAEK